MNFASKEPLQHGTVPLLRDEIEYKIQEHVDLYEGDHKVHRGGTVKLTTLRIIYLLSTENQALIFQWKHVTKLSCVAGGFFVGSPKTVIHFSSTEDSVEAFIQLSFKSGGSQDFHDKACQALNEKAWKTGEREIVHTGLDASRAGLVGLNQKHHRELQNASELSQNAFASLDVLRANAKEVVHLATKYAELRARQEAESASADTMSDTSQKRQFGDLLLQIGLSSPVTRQAAGDRYHLELAAQLAHFIRATITEVGGIMSLADVYCVYNRARGTSLVSPDDLSTACELFNKSDDYGVHLQTLSKGVKVLVLNTFSHQRMADRLVSILSETNWVSAAQLTDLWQLPLHIVQYFLECAEGEAKVCRDDSPYGIRYYRNVFVDD